MSSFTLGDSFSCDSSERGRECIGTLLIARDDFGDIREGSILGSRKLEEVEVKFPWKFDLMYLVESKNEEPTRLDVRPIVEECSE